MTKVRLIVEDRGSRERAMQAIFNLAPSQKKKWRITIESETRSLQQNRLYHEWVSQIAQHTGHGHDEVHEWLRGQFLPAEFADINGCVVEVRKSTTRLTVKEMAEYMEHVRALAAELGLHLRTIEEESLERMAS